LDSLNLLTTLATFLRQSLDRSITVLHAHPRSTAATVALLLLGSGFAAFGVAPMTPTDSTPLTTRLISEPIAPPGLQGQLELLDTEALSLHSSDRLRAGDTADSLLRRLGIDDGDAAQFLRHDPVAQQIFTGRSGKQVQATAARSADGLTRLVELTVRGPAAKADTARDRQTDADAASEVATGAARLFTRTVVNREGERLRAETSQVPLAVQSRLASGLIETSLFAAADDAQIPDAVTMQLAEIFGSDIDFRRELRRGDHFAVVYEALTADGEPVTWGAGNGRVLAARFVNKGETHEAYWFEPPGQRGGYYGADGLSKTRMFLASPLAFSRVTSGFAMRFHPILKTWKAHLGVDYAAPSGTPVRSVGDASVSFAGWQNGYGNVVELRHAGDKITVYAHLSHVNVRTGQHVAQGDVLGAVGATGWATGPHLHFEFKLAGHQVDPLRVARSSEAVALSPAARPRFDALQRATAQTLAAAERQKTSALARME
jgi:murein DD-endopeptidase MepM/ murein hydrolase activator NlpD